MAPTENRIAAITGGGAGIGLAIARRLARDGVRLAVSDIDADALSAVAAEFPGAIAERADVSDDGAMAGFFARIGREAGGLDILVANAGAPGPTGRVEEIAPAAFRRCLEIGLGGQFTCAHHAVPMLRARGGGSIICMASVAGKYGYAYRTPYAAAKFGVIGLAQSLAKELGPDDIRVNAILPGIVAGSRMDGVIAARAEAEGVSFDRMRAQYLQKVSLGRMVTAEDVAEMVAFLVSPAGGNISGQNIAVDGNVETL